MNLEYSNDKILVALVGLGLTGWNSYLQLARKSMEEKVKDLKEWIRNINTQVEALKKSSMTREEHSEFRVELTSRLDRIEGKLDRFLERKNSE